MRVVVAGDDSPVPSRSSPAVLGPSTSQSRPRRSVGLRSSALPTASSNAVVLRWYACIAWPSAPIAR